jgi:hypothetical protein
MLLLFNINVKIVLNKYMYSVAKDAKLVEPFTETVQRVLFCEKMALLKSHL